MTLQDLGFQQTPDGRWFLPYDKTGLGYLTSINSPADMTPKWGFNEATGQWGMQTPTRSYYGKNEVGVDTPYGTLDEALASINKSSNPYIGLSTGGRTEGYNYMFPGSDQGTFGGQQGFFVDPSKLRQAKINYNTGSGWNDVRDFIENSVAAYFGAQGLGGALEGAGAAGTSSDLAPVAGGGTGAADVSGQTGLTLADAAGDGATVAGGVAAEGAASGAAGGTVAGDTAAAGGVAADTASAGGGAASGGAAAGVGSSGTDTAVGSGLSNAGIWGQILGAGISAYGARSAAKTQAAAGREAIGEQAREFDIARAALQPYQDVGGQALFKLRDYLGLGAPGSAPSAEQIMAQDPGYQFRLGQGNQAITNAASARGMNLSGATLKELLRYGSDYASGEFSNIINRLSGVAGMGQASAAGSANLSATQGQNAAGIIQGIGNARAAGQVGQANALGGAVSNISNAYLLKNLLNQNQSTSAQMGGTSEALA